MDRPVNPKAPPELRLVAVLAHHLLSASSRFETPVLRSGDAARDALRCFEALEKAARLSLPIVSPAQAPAAAPEGPSRPRAGSALPTVQYGTERSEYEPALDNPTLVKALLELHHRVRAPGTAPKVPPAGFQADRVPLVQAQPKPAPAKGPAMTRIFRPRSPL